MKEKEKGKTLKTLKNPKKPQYNDNVNDNVNEKEKEKEKFFFCQNSQGARDCARSVRKKKIKQNLPFFWRDFCFR